LTIFQFILYFFWQPKSARERYWRYGPIFKVFRRLRLSVLLMVLSVSAGAIGYVSIEKYEWLDAVYMAVITLASVGFSEVHPLSPMGRIFTIGLIVFNLGLFAYAISTVTSIFADGGFIALFNEFRMIQRVEHLKNHVIVCGFGRHATEVVGELNKQQIPFVVVESNAEKIEVLRDSAFLYIEGDATEDHILEEAGILRARAIVITLPHDSDNLFITLSARQINSNIRIISRANNLADEFKIRRAGADHTVVPERIGGYYMAALVNKPDAVELSELMTSIGPGKLLFEEIPVHRLQRDVLGKTIRESGLLEAVSVSLVALRSPNGQYEINPSHDTVLRPEHHIILLGNTEQIEQFNQLACKAY
jgi:voltage-gated potassium channel